MQMHMCKCYETQRRGEKENEATAKEKQSCPIPWKKKNMFAKEQLLRLDPLCAFPNSGVAAR